MQVQGMQRFKITLQPEQNISYTNVPVTRRTQPLYPKISSTQFILLLPEALVSFGTSQLKTMLDQGYTCHENERIVFAPILKGTCSKGLRWLMLLIRDMQHPSYALFRGAIAQLWNASHNKKRFEEEKVCCVLLILHRLGIDLFMRFEDNTTPLAICTTSGKNLTASYLLELSRQKELENFERTSNNQLFTRLFTQYPN
jgi:hypothetical protein